jgi:predicted NUDIX family NTP pyrophosphohydrolase
MVLESPSQPANSATVLRSAVGVRLVLFAIHQGELWVAVARAHGNWELPSASLNSEESLDAAALRALREHLGA